MTEKISRGVKWLVGVLFLILIIILGMIFTVQSAHLDEIVAEQSLASSTAVAIVFGAGLNPDGKPRDLLE